MFIFGYQLKLWILSALKISEKGHVSEVYLKLIHSIYIQSVKLHLRGQFHRSTFPCPMNKL